jgi:GNAT superfamily N-acetyltransferase
MKEAENHSLTVAEARSPLQEFPVHHGRRTGENEDVEILRAYTRHLSLIVGLFDEYRQSFEQPPNPAGGRAFLGERLERRDSVIFFASEGSGSFQRALGFTQIYPGWSSVWMRKIWILNDLYVHPDRRGQGIAKALHGRARQHAVETKAHGLALSTAREDEAVRHLCETLGYRRDERVHHFFLRVDD